MASWRILLVGSDDSTSSSPTHTDAPCPSCRRVAPGAKPSARQKLAADLRQGVSDSAAEAQAPSGRWARGAGAGSGAARRRGSGARARSVAALPQARDGLAAPAVAAICATRTARVAGRSPGRPRPARSCGRRPSCIEELACPRSLGEGTARSSGTTSASMTSSDSHDRWLGRARRPGDRPRSSGRQPRDERRAPVRARQVLLACGANHCIDRWSSTRPSAPSIQPKHSASSTASSYDTVGLPARFFHVTSHTPESRRGFPAARLARQLSIRAGREVHRPWRQYRPRPARASRPEKRTAAARDAPAHRQTDAPPANLSA